MTIIAAALALVLTAGSGIALFRGRGGARTARMRRDGAYRKLEQYYAQDPFPSRANVQRAYTNMIRIRAGYTNLLGALSEGAIEAVEQSPSMYIDRLQTLARDLYREAPRPGGEPVMAPPFAFGFGAYLNEGSMPAREIVPRLTRQLLMTRRLIRLFFETGVHKIDDFERDVFENVESVGRETVGRGSAASTSASVWGGEGLLSSEHIPAEIERFNVRLKMRQQTLVRLLNRLGSMQPLVMVNDMSLQKNGEALRKAPAEEPPEASPESARARFTRASVYSPRGGGRDAAAPKKNVDPRSLPREKRLISGPPLEPYLDVRLEIVFFNFKKEPIRVEP